jgi:NitT/TauT family transport system ATP-binding protein
VTNAVTVKVTTSTSELETSPALVIRGLEKKFGSGNRSTVALQSFGLTVVKGEFITIVGASGCGKSTLLSLVAGLEKPTAGSLEVNGQVAFMFQDATLLPWLTAKQNIELALRLRGVPRKERSAKAVALLARVRLDHAADRRPHELSGGMRQRVALARCLAQEARIVLMDEPLGALDAMTRDLLHDEIERVAQEAQLTVLFVTHNMREAIRLGDRVILMGNDPGRIVHEQRIDLARPRQIDSADVATRAADLTKRLREVSTHGDL